MQILEVELLSKDLQGTKAFYREVLGLPVVDEKSRILSIGVGASRLTFHLGEGSPVYHFAFNIPFQQVEEAHNWIAIREKVQLITPPGKLENFSNWKARSFYFWDNNGNVVEFIGREPLDCKGAGPFGPASLLSISEIGLVAENVGKEADRLTALYGIPVFARQPRLQHFAALGDDHGLLILSGNKRNWYPTEAPARAHWMRVVFEQESRIFSFEANR